MQPGDRRVEAGAEDRVDDQRAVADLGEVQLPRLAVGDLDDGEAEAAEDLEVDARVAAHVGDAADQEHRHVDAALQQRARDDEAVAAVVAAAAEHGDLPLEQIAVHRLHRRHHLAAGVLHQHERRDADVVDRAAIGFAHLGGVQDTHRLRALTQHDGHRHGCTPACLAPSDWHERARWYASRYGSHGQRQRPRLRSGARRHLGLRSRISLRRGRLRDAAHLQRPAVSLRPPHAAAAHVGRHARAADPADRRARSTRASARRCAPPASATAPDREAYIRILVTRGIGELTYDPAARPPPSIVVIVKPHVDPPREVFERGVKVSLVGVVRNHPGIGESADQVEQPAEQRAGDAGGASPRRVRRRDAELQGRARRVHAVEPVHREGRRGADAAASTRACCRASRASSCSRSAPRPASRSAKPCCTTRICSAPTRRS